MREENHADVVVFEVSEIKRERYRKKKQKLHLWKRISRKDVNIRRIAEDARYQRSVHGATSGLACDESRQICP